MDTKELEKLHRVLLVVMDEIDRICVDNEIEYSLIGGSLIGAIRHKGFIPWDDDIDIAMTRDDYEKFKKVCSTCLNKEYFFQDITTDKDYPYGFGKLVLNGTVCISSGHEDEEWQKGIFVDVFPMDNVPNGSLSRAIHSFRNILLIKLIEGKTGRDLRKAGFIKKLIYKVLDIFGSALSFKFLTERLDENMQCHNGSDTARITNLGGFYGYKRESTEASFFKTFMRVPFEDREYNIICNYDQYLKSVFGDYMKLPPVEQRRTHEFAKLDFGKYRDIV